MLAALLPFEQPKGLRSVSYGLLPVIARYCHLDIPGFFRGDAAFVIPELYAFLEAEIHVVCDPYEGQRGAGAKNRAPADRSRGTAFSPAQGFLSQLPVPIEVLAEFTSRGGEDRMARGRAISSRRSHRDQFRLAVQERDQVLKTVAARPSS